MIDWLYIGDNPLAIELHRTLFFVSVLLIVLWPMVNYWRQIIWWQTATYQKIDAWEEKYSKDGPCNRVLRSAPSLVSLSRTAGGRATGGTNITATGALSLIATAIAHWCLAS